MIVGANAPNDRITAADVAVFQAARFTGAIVRPYHTRPELDQLRAVLPDVHLILQLPDVTWTEGEGETKRTFIPGADKIAEQYCGLIDQFHNWGVPDFAFDNEPNEQAGFGGVRDATGRHVAGDLGRPWDWQKTMMDVMDLVQPHAAQYADVRLICSAFSDWGRAEWMQAATTLAARFHAVSAHCYWQAPGDAYSRAFGANFRDVHDKFPTKPLVITEFGTSIGQITPPPTPAEIAGHMQREYVAWLRWVRRWFPWVEGAYAFLVAEEATGWPVFRVTAETAAVLKAIIPQR